MAHRQSRRDLALLVAMAGAALAVLIGGAIGFTGGMTFVTPDGGGQLPPGAGAAWLGALYALFFAWPCYWRHSLPHGARGGS